jgi:trimeric autotransporter adhesin
LSNTANGLQALYSNIGGRYNTGMGVQALYSNSSGNSNTATGYRALSSDTGSNNIGLGYNAGSSLTTGSGNVCIGAGVLGVPGESNTTRIKNVYASIASARAVYVNSDNKIGTLASSRRYKEDVKKMDKASEAILALKPVTFRYKKEIEPNGAIMFGLIAEEVEKVDPDLVTRDAKGEAETVRYDVVNAMLLNEFLKEHQKVQRLEAALAAVNERLKAQDAKIDKVNAKVELAKPALPLVNNSQ